MVDLKDLKSIMERGVLSIDEHNCSNWSNDKRAFNSTEVIYLFNNAKNIPIQYGLVMLEIELNEAEPSIMCSDDVNFTIYDEWVCQSVPKECIKKVIILNIFKNYVQNYIIDVPVTWCAISGKHWKVAEFTNEDWDSLAETMNYNTDQMGYFRGTRKDRTVFDVYDVRYNITE